MTTVRLGSIPAACGLADAVESRWESVLIVDPDGQILQVNPAFETVTGYRPDELIGQHVSIVRMDPDSSAWTELVTQPYTGEPWRLEFVGRRSDGSAYPAEASILPLLDGRGATVAYLTMARDASARRELEIHARQGARLQALGQLVAQIAHDVNNQLFAIRGFGEFVQASLPPASEAGPDMHLLMRAVDSATDLTRELLSYSRRQLPVVTRLDLGVLVDGMAAMLRRVIGDRVELIVSHGAGPSMIVAEAIGIEQLIVNLAINARDAMPDHGSLLIRVEGAAAKLDGGGPYEVVRLTVADTGIGMSASTLARINEPFFTTKAPGHGTGLGLTTVYSIVREVGGAITIDSEPGQGTTFTIDFPAAPFLHVGDVRELPRAEPASAEDRT